MLPLKQFQDFIEQEELFNKDDKILLAVSGGKDSVLMFHLFKSTGVNIGVAHCNFNLRADESLRDENFVKLLAKSYDVPLYVTHFATKKYAEAHKISTQMAARELRYQWFEEIRSANHYDYIAIAHHQNDTVETMLINLVRGTGIAGLHGILPKREKLIRPLLFLNGDEINEHIVQNNLDFVEDSSNLSADYTRNKIRLKVLPHLKEINPHLEQTFIENAARFAALESFLNNSIKQLAQTIFHRKPDGIYITKSDIEKLNPPKLLLFELLKPYGFAENTVSEILSHLNSISGTRFLSQTHQLTINRNEVVLSLLLIQDEVNVMIHPSTTSITFGNHEIEMSFRTGNEFIANKNIAFVESAALIFPLIVRNWQQGDKFMPLGMRHLKKLSDFFIDEKIPLHLKNSTPILVNGNGDIIWVVGMRQDNRYKLTASTKKVAIFDVKSK